MSEGMPAPGRATRRRALRRCCRVLGTAGAFGWALFHLGVALVLVATFLFVWVALLPVRGDVRHTWLRMQPRYRRRLRISDEQVDSAFARIVTSQFGRDG